MNQKFSTLFFDMVKVNYFGSSMLEAMLYLWKKINTEGGKMAVCCVSDTAREILELSRFDTIWPICQSQGGSAGKSEQLVHGLPVLSFMSKR